MQSEYFLPCSSRNHQLANVLDHPLVQRAMRVFQSVGEVGVGANQSADRGDCNYVRFFRLAKRLTFLQACAVSRHFDAVRFDALHKMASAYNARRAQRPMPMERIVRQLGFDGLRDAEAFVTMFGQDCSQGVLQLCGEMLTQPDGRDYLPVVQHRWLDNLRQGSDLGVVVNGGQRPPVVRHVPHDSFNGLYVSAREVYADEEEEEQEQEEEIMVEEEEDEQEVAVEEPMQEEEAAVAQTAREAAARRAVIAPQPTGAKGTAAAPTVKRVVEKAPAVIPAPTLSGTKPSVPISAASPLAPATSLRSLFGNTAVPATTASAGTTTIASSVPPFGKFAPPAMTTTSSLPPTATATFATSAATLLSLPAPPTYLQQQQKAAAADKVGDKALLCVRSIGYPSSHTGPR